MIVTISTNISHKDTDVIEDAKKSLFLYHLRRYSIICRKRTF